MVAVVFAVRPGCPRRLLRRDHPEVGKAVVRLGGVAIHDGLLAHGRLSAWGRERGADHLQHPPHRDDIGVSVGQRDPVEGDQVAAAAADGLGHLRPRVHGVRGAALDPVVLLVEVGQDVPQRGDHVPDGVLGMPVVAPVLPFLPDVLRRRILVDAEPTGNLPNAVFLGRQRVCLLSQRVSFGGRHGHGRPPAFPSRSGSISGHRPSGAISDTSCPPANPGPVGFHVNPWLSRRACARFAALSPTPTARRPAPGAS